MIITHICGHKADCYIRGAKTPYGKNRIAWEEGRLCSECWKEEQLKEAQETTADLLPLTGSDKQIKWATTIRAKAYQAMTGARKLAEETGDDQLINWLKEKEHEVFSRTQSQYWIDNRNSDYSIWIQQSLPKILKA